MNEAVPRPENGTPIADMQIDPSTPLFRVRSVALLFITRVTSNTSNQMLAVAVGYQVYELTDSALHLGLIGLVQFLPPLLLMLIAGQVADRYNRRLVLRCCFAVELCATAGLVMVAACFPRPSLAAIYALLLVNAIARTFEQPVMQSLVPVMAPRVDAQPGDRRARVGRAAVDAARPRARRRALHLRTRLRLRASARC